MVMEVEVDMEGVLDHFNLLDRDAGGDPSSCCSDRSGRGGSPGKEAGVVKERIARALRLYKEAADELGGGGALVQVWAPARDGRRRRVLATRGQPFVLASQCHRLFQYRTISLTHVFPVDGRGGAGEQGMPGRAFDARAPEWTPNVQFYSSGEYARISYALIYDIQGSLALPILDPDTRCCLAVLELVMTAPTVRFAGEVDKLYKALQAVALRGSEICLPVVEVCNSEAIQFHPAMAEVSEILATVCEAHELPIAQAWVRCKRCSPETQGAEHFALTTAGAPFYLAGGGACGGFREACVEHHLWSGRGHVGAAAAAAMTRRPRLCADVTKCSKDAYPLAHYARMYGLVGCLAMCLRVQSSAGSIDGDGGEVCVLELFFPPDRTSVVEQKAAAEAVAAMIREECCVGDHRKVTVTCDMQDLSLEITADGDHHVVVADADELNDPGDYGEKDSGEEDVNLAADRADDGAVNVIHIADRNGGEDPGSQQVGKKKMRRGKAEKYVSLEQLQGYFSGSLKDAARSLGVCPTTMKRMCRQHGIPRWPFQKINKIKRAVESAKCSPEYMAASAPQPAPAPHLPCLSGALGVASSQGSCHEPSLANSALRRPLQGGTGGGGVVTIKASYRGDIVRFRVPCSASVSAVKEEVSKRLGMDADAFDVKYLDDDHEWVLLSCDADFQECLEVAPALLPSLLAAANGSGAVDQMVRLMVQEVADNLGSSCGSSD